jgi:uncharacterized membrane protein (DUF373 family)
MRTKGGPILLELLKDVSQFFKKNIWPISILTLAIEFPYILIQNIHYFTNTSSEFSNNIGLILLMATLIIYPLSTGAQISLYAMIIEGTQIDLKKCVSNSRKHLFNLVVGSLIYIFFTFLGFLVFIVPGIIIAVRLSFYCFFIVLDDLPPVDALKKSAQVTKGYTWQIANALIVVGCLLVASLLLIQLFLNEIGLYNLYFGSVVDSLFSILGWLSLILVFRFYCLYQENIKSESDPPAIS